jgi:hypothetical protein
MARDCYKRQQGVPSTTLKQNTTTLQESPSPPKKPVLIEFQQYPTFVKRPLDTDDNDNKNDDQNQPSPLPPQLLPDSPMGSSSNEPTSFNPTWGTGTYKEEQQDSMWGEIQPKKARHNSPDIHSYRSGICQFCDTPLGSKKMNGPLTCKACRVLLEEDKAHEKEQQDYNNKRQAVRQSRYDAQLAGTAEEAKHQDTQRDDETKGKNNASSQESLTTPNSPTARPETGWGFPQNFVRITLAQLYQT